MTAQFRNRIYYDGESHLLAVNPLSCYLKERIYQISSNCSACWDGYLTKWEIIDGKLYLLDINPCFVDDDNVKKKLTMDYLFLGQKKVFAEWYSGEILIQKGEMLNYVHMGYASTYEKHILIEIKKGDVIDVRIEDNRGKTFPEKGEKRMTNLFNELFGDND